VVLPLLYQLTQVVLENNNNNECSNVVVVLEKRPLNGCSINSSSTDSVVLQTTLKIILVNFGCIIVDNLEILDPLCVSDIVVNEVGHQLL